MELIQILFTYRLSIRFKWAMFLFVFQWSMKILNSNGRNELKKWPMEWPKEWLLQMNLKEKYQKHPVKIWKMEKLMINLPRTLILVATKFQLLKAIADEDVPEVLQMETNGSEALALRIDVIGQSRDRNLHRAGLNMKTDQIVEAAGLRENLNLLIEVVNHLEADHHILIPHHGSNTENDCTCCWDSQSIFSNKSRRVWCKLRCEPGQCCSSSIFWNRK